MKFSTSTSQLSPRGQKGLYADQWANERAARCTGLEGVVAYERCFGALEGASLLGLDLAGLAHRGNRFLRGNQAGSECASLPNGSEAPISGSIDMEHAYA